MKKVPTYWRCPICGYNRIIRFGKYARKDQKIEQRYQCYYCESTFYEDRILKNGEPCELQDEIEELHTQKNND